MIRRSTPLLTCCAVALLTAACSSSNNTNTTPVLDAGTDAHTPSVDAGLTTIAAAITGNVKTPITVQAIVTALHGTIPNDVTEWYIEDLAGGPHSGVAVYCDPLLTKCPAAIRAPARWTVVQMTGTLSAYQGMMEFIPTSQTIISDAGTPPPIETVAMADLAPTGNSQYRGVLVKLAAGTTLTVDNVTPSPLLDSKCAPVAPSVDAGTDAATAGTDGGSTDSGTDGGASDAGSDAVADASTDSAATDADDDASMMDAAATDATATDSGPSDATLSDATGGTDAATGTDAAVGKDAATFDAATPLGPAVCATPCSPPAYSGFTANDGKGNEVNIEATFFATDPLQSSPECLTQPGVVPVTVGKTFSAMEGILDFDGYAQQQQLSPVMPADYTTP